MLSVLGATCRRALGKTIRVLGAAASFTITLVLGFAPAAGAIAVGCLIRNHVMASALIAGASLGVFVVSRFRDLRNCTVDRNEPEQSVQRREPVAPPVVTPTMAPVPNDLLAFHDFDRVKNRFDHW